MEKKEDLEKKMSHILLKTLVVAFGYLVVLLIVTPYIKEIFIGMNKNLSQPTITVLILSDFVNGWKKILLPLLIFPTSIYFVLPFVIDNKTVIIKIYSIILYLLIIFLCLIGIGLFMPLLF